MKIIKLLSIFTLLTLQLHSQHFCGTKDTDIDEWIAQMEKMGGRPTTKILNTRSTIYIPMHYHVVTKSDKTGGFPLNYLFSLHCDLNQRYADAGIDIKFYIDTISYIYSSTLFDMTNTEESQINTFNTLKHCNVYLVNDPAGACGYTYRPNTFNSPSRRSAIYLQASYLNTNCTEPGSTTLTHEMGHWLDLPHTFYGWEGKTYVNQTSPTGIRRENVARTGTNANCSTNGDGFCDTDPDYVSDRWTCPSSTQYKDPTGAIFTLNATNYMCYTSDVCMNKFSDLQKSQIVFSMSKYNERKDLAALPVPNYLKIDSFKYYYPKTTNATTRISTTNLKLIYSKQANATMYNVTLAKGTTVLNSAFNFAPTTILIDTLVSDTFLYINPTVFGTITNNNNYYYWKVRAINKLYPCNESVIKYQSFRITDMNVSISLKNVTCNGDADGRITINNNSGLSNLKFYMDNSIITDLVQDNLPGGYYTIDIKKTDNSVVTFAAPIAEPEKLSGTIKTDANRITEVFPTGGIAPYSYLWSNNKTTKQITDQIKGEYKVTITDKNNCKSNELKTSLDFSSINTAHDNSVQIYPTELSAHDNLTVLLSNNIGHFKMTIYNLQGVIVYNNQWEHPESKLSIPINITTSGVYLIESELNDNKYQNKLIVK